MNAQNSNWVRIGTLSDIPVRGSRKLEINDVSIALFRSFDDRVFALEDACPHKKGPLSQGIVHDGCVTCPLHNWVISLESGKAQGADEGQTRTFSVSIQEDEILINLAEISSTIAAGEMK